MECLRKEWRSKSWQRERHEHTGTMSEFGVFGERPVVHTGWVTAFEGSPECCDWCVELSASFPTAEAYVGGMLFCLGIFLSFYLLTILLACWENWR